METSLKANTDLGKKIETIEKEVQPALYEQSLNQAAIAKEPEKVLNEKIMKITMKIKDQYPQLSKYLEELPETIPDEKKPEINLDNLKTYYESLESMLNKYILENPTNGK